MMIDFSPTGLAGASLTPAGKTNLYHDGNNPPAGRDTVREIMRDLCGRAPLPLPFTPQSGQ
jgi:hypothetical protein